MASSNWFPIHRIGPTMAIELLAAIVLSAAQLNAVAAEPAAGFVEYRGEKILLHTPSERANISNVTLQYSDARNRTACCMRVDPKDVLQEGPSSSVTAITDGDDAPVFTYELRQSSPVSARLPFVGLALINVRPTVASTAASMTAKSDQGKPVRVRKCIASEGIQLTANSTVRVAKLYYSLGYTVDPKAMRGQPVCAGAHR